jgi:hypothetical protein
VANYKEARLLYQNKKEKIRTLKMERIVNLCRMKRGDQGTRGMLFYDDFSCHTLELPWRNNQQNISCIPDGEYLVETRVSPKYGKIYWVRNVPNRSYVLIHSGNVAGDKTKGYKTHVAGCILLGQRRGLLWGQWAVLNSRITVNRFMRKLQYEPFKLRILEAF